MSPILCLVVLVVLGSFQVSTIVGAPLLASNEELSKISSDLQNRAKDLAQKLDTVSTQIDTALDKADKELISKLETSEKEWSKKVCETATKHEACAVQISRLYQLLSQISKSTETCSSKHRQKILDVQRSSKLLSTMLKKYADKSGISVNCVSVNGKLPLCVVTTEPMFNLATLLREGSETVGSGSARAETYNSQILSCWKQSSMDASSLAQEIIRDIAQCAKAQS